MSTTCVLERVALALVTKLTELVTSGVATAVIRPGRGGRCTPAPAHGHIVLVQGAAKPELSPAGFQQWAQTFEAQLIVIPEDTDTTAVDPAINEFRAQVEKKLLEDAQFVTAGLSGAVKDTTILAPYSYDPAEKVDGVAVVFSVAYRHRHGNPYSWT